MNQDSKISQNFKAKGITPNTKIGNNSQYNNHQQGISQHINQEKIIPEETLFSKVNKDCNNESYLSQQQYIQLLKNQERIKYLEYLKKQWRNLPYYLQKQLTQRILSGNKQKQIFMQKNKNNQYQRKKNPQKGTIDSQKKSGKSPQSSHIKSQKKNIQGQLEKYGLPNIGNNCFLNSTLQLLFSAEGLRNQLLKYEKKYPKNKMQLTCTIFKLIESKGSSFQKRNILEKILGEISRTRRTYSLYSQDDAFTTLNELLEEFIERDEEIRHLFTVLVASKCPCMKRPAVVETMIITQDALTCDKCEHKFQEQYWQVPEFLIVAGNDKKNKITFQINNINYELIAKVSYVGNGRSGHYVCIRKNEDQILNISDNHVMEIDSFTSSQGFSDKILLYQKNEKTLFKERKNIQTQQSKNSLIIIKNPLVLKMALLVAVFLFILAVQNVNNDY